jgi:tungstate transport system ATP-binding protein
LSAVLEIRDLVVRRDQKIVVEVDHLDVEQGEVLAVIGPNGSGKSSLMLAIARLLKPERGQIVFNGKQPEHETPVEYRRRIGLVLQEPLLLDLSVYQNVSMGLRFRQIPQTDIKLRPDAWLKRLGIEHIRKRPARSLSGGEAQRVSLARALALQPELLLLDEPFSALDAPTRIHLLEDLHAILAETNTTTLFITHDLKEAAQLGDRLAIILNGKLHQQGTPAQVYAHPKDDEVRAFLGLAVN